VITTKRAALDKGSMTQPYEVSWAVARELISRAVPIDDRSAVKIADDRLWVGGIEGQDGRPEPVIGSERGYEPVQVFGQVTEREPVRRAWVGPSASALGDRPGDVSQGVDLPGRELVEHAGSGVLGVNRCELADQGGALGGEGRDDGASVVVRGVA